jgi:hypothetical protein
MTYLVDTNALSETRKRQPAPGVAEWIVATPSGWLHVSVLPLGEIEQGIASSRTGPRPSCRRPWPVVIDSAAQSVSWPGWLLLLATAHEPAVRISSI